MQKSACLILIMLILATGCAEDHQWSDFYFDTMGTRAHCHLELPPEIQLGQGAPLVQAVYDSVTTVFSTWDAGSEMSRLNRAPADSVVHLSPWFDRCLAQADELRGRSRGAFDPTAGPLMRLWGFYRGQGRLPSPAERDSACALVGGWRYVDSGAVVKTDGRVKFDLGAIAKGFAVDRAVERLQAAGVRNGLVDLGGNLYCLGGAQGRHDWRVGVRDPLDRNEHFATVKLSGQAVATSGSYERFVEIDGIRYGHIMNTATGLPATGVLSVSVVAPTAVLADGLSTTLFVLGPHKGGLLLRDLPPRLQGKVQAIMVLPAAEGEGEPVRVLVTPGLMGQVELVPHYQRKFVLEEWRL